MICLDEMGPERAKSFLGQQVVYAVPSADRPTERARQEIDYGRRGLGYIFGAVQPATSLAMTMPYDRRTIVDFADFLTQVDAWLPSTPERIYVILDNLNLHHTVDVLLFGMTHPRWEFVFQPVYAAYLNLIEPWWKGLRALALKGRCLATWEEVCAASAAATTYWNRHRYPFQWGHRRRHRPASTPGIALVANVR